MAKTNIGLVEYAKAQLGLPYWYCTYGQISSEELYKSKKAQYPRNYTASDFSRQYNKRVHDCVGLIKGYLWSDSPTSKPKYNSAQDVSANGMRSRCTKKGSMSSMPDVPGVLVFMNGHVGVYIGGGYVVEARGHAYGVVKTKLSGRRWTSWGYCPWIEYNNVPTEQPEIKRENTVNITLKELKRGAEGAQVKALQQLLLANGCRMPKYGADADFGTETETALKAYQKANGLSADGICGVNTWKKLLGV